METIKYKVVNGTSYHEETPDEVVTVLEQCRTDRTRVILDFGDVKTGKSWGETCKNCVLKAIKQVTA